MPQMARPPRRRRAPCRRYAPTGSELVTITILPTRRSGTSGSFQPAATVARRGTARFGAHERLPTCFRLERPTARLVFVSFTQWMRRALSSAPRARHGDVSTFIEMRGANATGERQDGSSPFLMRSVGLKPGLKSVGQFRRASYRHFS